MLKVCIPEPLVEVLTVKLTRPAMQQVNALAAQSGCTRSIAARALLEAGLALAAAQSVDPTA